MSENVSEIIPDADIEKVHGYANFGDMGKREVVSDGVLKAAFGYHSGHTQLCILLEHGLIRQPRPGKYDMNLTAKGKRYLRAAFGGKFRQIADIAAAESPS